MTDLTRSNKNIKVPDSQPQEGDKRTYWVTMFFFKGYRFVLCKDHHLTYDEALECIERSGNAGEGAYILEVESTLKWCTTRMTRYGFKHNLEYDWYVAQFTTVTDYHKDGVGHSLDEIRTQVLKWKAEYKRYLERERRRKKKQGAKNG